MKPESDRYWRARRVADGGLGVLVSEPETREAGKGGQFAKGGGRVPGRAVPARGVDEPFPRPPAGPLGTEGVVEVDKDRMRELREELRLDSKTSPELRDAAEFADYQRGGVWTDDAVWRARHRYSSSQYEELNQFARDGMDATRPGPRGRPYSPDVPDTVAQLDRGFTPPPARPLPKTVYRGVRDDDLGPTLQVGDRFRDDGFTSVSESGATAQRFSGALGAVEHRTDPRQPDLAAENKTVYRIRTTPETASTPVMPGNASEQEWVLPRGASFTVTGVTQFTTSSGGVHRVIDVEWDGVGSDA